MAYPIETVYQVFALYLDYVPVARIVDAMEQTYGESPNAQTIHKWAAAGEGTEGNQWKNIRDNSAYVRGKMAFNGTKSEPADYASWARESMRQLEILQDKVSRDVMVGKIAAKASDITKFAELRERLEFSQEERVGQKKQVVTLLGRILRHSYILTKNIHPDSERALQMLLELAAEEFGRFTMYQGDADEYQLRSATERTSGSLPPGTPGAELS